MAPERFTVRLNGDRAEWVDEQAEQRDRSRAWVIREAVDAARGEESAFGAVRTGAERTDAVRTDGQLEEVLERLEAIEGQISEGIAREVDATAEKASDAAQRTGAGGKGNHLRDGAGEAGNRGGDAGDGPDTADADDARALVDAVAEREGWDDDGRLEARKQAAAAAVRALRDRGQLGKTEAVEELGLFDDYRVAGQDAETWWRRNVRPVAQEIATYSRGMHAYVLDDEDDSSDVYDPTAEF